MEFSSRKLGYVPALDGLRAIAVLSVLLYHLDIPGFRMGFIGVDLFFVLSGFLITSLLVLEYERVGRISLPHFYWRRGLRLLPALLLVLAASLLLAQFFGSSIDQGATYTGAWSGLLYISNWVGIYGPPYGFGALHVIWSLAIEDQFYLMWAPLLAFLLWQRISRLALFTLLACGIFISIISSLLRWRASGNIYESVAATDARMQALLLGCVLALLFVWRYLPQSRTFKLLLAIIGLLCGGYILRVGLQPQHPFVAMVEGGYTVAALGSAALILLVLQSNKAAALLAFKPLVWVGSVSYGLYLWHGTIVWLLKPQRIGGDPLLLNLLAIALSFLATTASYYLVERYFLSLKDKFHARYGVTQPHGQT